MKQLTCEMCGSNDLLKQDGMFVCQSCGCKYSVEEAKRMMIEGNVDVSGSTVKVDNSAFVERYLQNARRAKQKEDWEETEKYYNMVEQNDPTNIEAIFYSAYGKAKRTLVDADLYKRQAAFKVLRNCISVIDDNFDIEKADELKEILEKISTDIMLMSTSEYVYNRKVNQYGSETWTDKYETITLFNGLNIEFGASLENIANKYPESEKNQRIYYYELDLKHAEWILQHGCLKNPEPIRGAIIKIHKMIHEIDESHIIPSEAPRQPSSSGGCYVATAVYGSYDCPQVWTLRRFRDYTLAETWHGRAFIRVYYAISPTLVKWFGHTEWFKNMWKDKLDRMVANLNADGVENTPYEDKNW